MLVIASVTKRWPRQPQPVLREVDFELGAGELVWLTGENGAGKTTLLRIVAGLIAPDAGRSSVCGLEPRARGANTSARSGCSPPAAPALYARMTARQHLDYWARLALRAAAAARRARRRVDRALRPRSRSRTDAWTASRWASASACASRWRSCTARAWCCSTSRRRASTTRAARLLLEAVDEHRRARRRDALVLARAATRSAPASTARCASPRGARAPWLAPRLNCDAAPGGRAPRPADLPELPAALRLAGPLDGVRGGCSSTTCRAWSRAARSRATTPTSRTSSSGSR